MESKNNKVIYTCVFSGYDNLMEPIKCDGWDYILFTDMDIESDIYEVRKIGLHGTWGSREVKINSHKWLPDYKEWFYFDSSMTIRNEFKIQTDFEWLGYKHRTLDPWCEFERIVELGKGDLSVIINQLNDYSEFLAAGLGHMAGGVLYRKNTESVRKLNDAWWQEFKKYPSRDQLSLYKVLHSDNKCNWGFLNNYYPMVNFEFQDHLTVQTARNPDGNIYEFTPSGTGEKYRDYGEALNRHCAQVPYDEDWIIIRDQDTMYFPNTDHRRIIREASIKYPDTGIFGAYTNRIGLKWQLPDNVANDETDIMKLYEIAQERKELGSDCDEVNKPIAGFFMMFRKRVWRNVRFKEGDFASHHDALFDWEFSQCVLSMGLKTRLIKGLYLFHFYRFQQDDIRDTKHLFD